MKDRIRISEIGLYLRCPRLVYFQSLGTLEPGPRSARHLLLRHLMLSLDEEGADLGRLEEVVARLDVELPLIYREELDREELSAAASVLREQLPDLARSLLPLLKALLPCQVDVELRGDRVGLSGRLDRLVSRGPELVPSLIRGGNPPETGVWKRDRLQLAGYALLVEERFGQTVRQGQVEYPLAGEVRPVLMRSVDRARVLRLRDRIGQIKAGQLPDRPEEAPCQSCKVADSCLTRHSLASRFF
ncbi:MAG: Dna2/Cas4 domain-containing protein [Methanosarcinales archaeon]|nr:Dna2/Cas4 domain-containing protein [Methanosarcinales archaeon]